MVGYMKDNGEITLSKVRDMRNLPIIRFIMAHIIKESHMGMESMNGKMERIMKGNGWMG